MSHRIDSVPGLVIVTYREDGLDRAHPLRRLLGELPGTDAVRRLITPPLSLKAVASLAGSSVVDPASLHRVTGGYPFFVTEVLEAPEVLTAPDGRIPATVRDVVLARAARLGRDAAVSPAARGKERSVA